MTEGAPGVNGVGRSPCDRYPSPYLVDPPIYTGMTNQRRQPKGRPIGGQYATADKSEPASTSIVPETDWGSVDEVEEGGRSPWGEIQYVREDPPGLAWVMTAGHGGVKLSPERNRAIPAALRKSSRWYEEDCEFAIAEMYHADTAERRAEAAAVVRDEWPDKYEAATGIKVELGQSRARDEALWMADREAAGDWVVQSASNLSDGSGVLVYLGKTVNGEEARDGRRCVVVPTDEYRSQHDTSKYGSYTTPFYIPADAIGRYEEREIPVEPPPPPLPRATGVDTSQFPWKEMRQPWRLSSGAILSTEQLIAGGHVIGLDVAKNGRRSLRCSPTPDDNSGTFFTVPVSKATGDAILAAMPKSED